MPALSAGLRRLALACAVAGSSIALLVAAMVVASVVGRAAFDRPVLGDVELVQFGIGLALSLGLPWCQAQRGNIVVDFFTSRVDARMQRLLDSAGALLLALMCMLLAWRSAEGAWATRQAQETSMNLELPMWWTYASLAPGLALTACVALVQVFERGPAVPPPAAAAPSEPPAGAGASPPSP